MTAKIHFLYVGWHTRLLRFHCEQPYRARVESCSILVVIKSRISQFSLVTPLNSLSDD